MAGALRGDELPAITGRIPGPASAALARRLARVESCNITQLTQTFPVFWTEARGAAVRDADENVYVDLTAGFGVAHAGHAHPRVAAAIAEQARRLAHGLGDVHPPAVKVELLERLAAIAPGNLGVTILGSAGAEGIEAALKTARLRTGRSGVLAFEGGYHGLTYGALAVTHRQEFREPFRDQLFAGVRHAPYPDAAKDDLARTLETLDRAFVESDGTPHAIGAVVVEPILGRGGLVVPPAGFLPALRERCDGNTTLLILDEVYTGVGRTGRWFACEHSNVVPDILVAGKALTGSLPLSAAIGTPDVMQAWPASTGEALHTSTFLGNPVACAAALAQLAVIEDEELIERAAVLGTHIHAVIRRWTAEIAGVRAARGQGLLQGVVLETAAAARVMEVALRRGVLVLPEGPAGDVLAITPPAAITDAQLDASLDILEDALRREL